MPFKRYEEKDLKGTTALIEMHSYCLNKSFYCSLKHSFAFYTSKKCHKSHTHTAWNILKNCICSCEAWISLWILAFFFFDWCHLQAWYCLCSTIPGHFIELLSMLIVFFFSLSKKGTRWRKHWCKTMFTTRMNKSTWAKVFLRWVHTFGSGEYLKLQERHSRVRFHFLP